MLTFFRKIRRSLIKTGSTRKYILYALGEISLVVIGILIALQVNNWNSKKAEQAKIKEFAISLVQDLEQDIQMIDTRSKQMVQIISRIDSLSKIVFGKKIKEISNIDFLCLSWNLLYPPFNWNRATLDQMKSSGSLQFIKDVSLLKRISDYDALTQHLDEDYLNDKTKSDNAAQLANRVTNNNYPNMVKLRNEALLKINNLNYDEFQIFSEPEYKKAKEYQLNLISENINEAHEVVNSLIRLQFHYTIRSKVEADRVKENANAIITKLRENYFN